MKISELMNYRFENPTNEVAVDTKILEKFISRDRSLEQSEFFALWSSVSNEAINMLPVMNNYLQEQRQIGIVR